MMEHKLGMQFASPFFLAEYVLQEIFDSTAKYVLQEIPDSIEESSLPAFPGWWHGSVQFLW